jgi:hypothetical protein
VWLCVQWCSGRRSGGTHSTSRNSLERTLASLAPNGTSHRLVNLSLASGTGICEVGALWLCVCSGVLLGWIWW